MKQLALITLLTTLAFAQSDNAADIFYRAFWLEQAGGKAAEAEALYREVVTKHASAPEAPRAFLGIVRIRAARGTDVDEFIRLLEKDYPKAKKQIERARQLAASLLTPFSATPRPEDGPVLKKIKELYVALLAGGVAQEIKVFLADLGRRAHPMLSALLRQTDHGPVHRATEILLMQRTKEAYAVIEQAMRDQNVLFRTAIVDTVGRTGEFPGSLGKAITDLYGNAAPHLRLSIVRAVGKVLHKNQPHTMDVLERALSDEDEEVRRAATKLAGNAWRVMPDSTALALVKRFQLDDPANSAQPGMLFHLAHRAAVVGDVEKFLIGYRNITSPNYGTPKHDEAWTMLARVVVARRTKNDDENHYNNVNKIVSKSASATLILLNGALESGDADLAQWVTKARSKLSLTPKQIAGLKNAAIAAAYTDRAKVGGTILSKFGLGKDDWPRVRAVLEANKGKGMSWVLVTPQLIEAIGPVKAATLARYCVKQYEFEAVLVRGQALVGNGEQALPFFEALVPHTGPRANVATLVPYNVFQPLLARHLLKQEDPAWGWEREMWNRGSGAPGPKTWNRLYNAWSDDAARTALFAAIATDRVQIAKTAIKAAISYRDVPALTKALDSKWSAVRRDAIKYLGRNNAAQPLAKFLEREGISVSERRMAFAALAMTNSKAHAPVVAKYLAKRDAGSSGDAWHAYRTLAPKEAVELALKEIAGPGNWEYRDGALRTLTRTADERRIAVFRKILQGHIKADVARVLRTVAEQYLIELGEETLKHLRNPDNTIRSAATSAIERLKFYADAKKAFKDG